MPLAVVLIVRGGVVLGEVHIFDGKVRVCPGVQGLEFFGHHPLEILELSIPVAQTLLESHQIRRFQGCLLGELQSFRLDGIPLPLESVRVFDTKVAVGLLEAVDLALQFDIISL